MYGGSATYFAGPSSRTSAPLSYTISSSPEAKLNFPSAASRGVSRIGPLAVGRDYVDGDDFLRGRTRRMAD